jgi:hypothetical protein
MTTRPTPDEPQPHGALAALPRRDVDPEVAARVLRVSRRAFDREHAEGRPPWLSPVAHAWSHFLVPVVLASAATLYLAWAFTITLYP